MSGAVVFAGPSLAGAGAPPPGIALAPPAAAGDLYRAARNGASVIGLVDGVFEDRPTVWHKEILWALDRGVRVIGAASLGALRAAECAAFGMEGVGRVFALVRDGVIEDDSDLALVHAPAALGWQPMTEARVNVRATLDAAVAERILPRRAARRVAARAEALPFRRLTWTTLAEDLDPSPRVRLTDWLPQGRVDVKRDDALALLSAVARAVGGEPSPPQTPFDFPDTRYWRSSVAWFDSRPADGEDAAVLDELRLDPARFQRALVRALASRAAVDPGAHPPTDPRGLVEAFRLDLGLGSAADFADWLDRNRTDVASLSAALAAEDALDRTLDEGAAVLARSALDALRADGRYESVARRAADKRARLSGRAPAPYAAADLASLVEALCARRRVSVDPDLDAAARALGLPDRRALHRLLADERDYLLARPEDDG